MAIEDFEGGYMLWREDTTRIYALHLQGFWRSYEDTWQEGDPEYTCGTAASPPTPKRGFGKVWCTYDIVRQGLGEATTTEQGLLGDAQSFSGGDIIQPSGQRIFTLFDDATWE